MKIINRKFYRDYKKLESFEAGVVLSGAEVKSIRQGRLKLEDAYVKIIGNEIYLINAQIAPYSFARMENYDSKRTRKLLLKKKEIVRLKTKMQSGKGLTIIPVSCYNKGSFLKLEIALAEGRKETEKRRLEKRKKMEREEEKEVKEWLRNY